MVEPYSITTACRSQPIWNILGNASRVSHEEKSGDGVRKASRGCIQQRPGNFCDGVGTKCIGFCLFIGPFQRRREGGLSAWVISTYPGFAHWRGHTSFAMQRRHNMRKQQSTGYKSQVDWHRASRQGLLPSVGEVIAYYRAATACLKLSNPHTLRCCPTKVR